ncbi:MAG: hypothetical protein JRF25_11945, partial [Deltaproteobacteria bacterium]|nr:hypothetical protein [Deltaproteobacteria bacterium]
VKEPLPRKLKIGFSPDLGYAVVQSDVAASVEEGVKVFEKIGHKVESLKSGPPMLGSEWAIFGGFELSAKLNHLFVKHEKDFGRAFLSGIKGIGHLTPEWWKELMTKRASLNDWCAEVFDRFDLLVTPTVPFDPPLAKGPFPEETEGRKQVPVGGNRSGGHVKSGLACGLTNRRAEAS